MRRFWALVVGVLCAGIGAMGCGSSSSGTAVHTSVTPTTATASGSADFAWLSARAEPWNHKLNHDQIAINSASRATSGVAGSAYFSRLSAACTSLFDDARGAQAIVHAPSATLNGVWQGMVVQTKAYASGCLTLARSHTNADLTAWNSSLTAMNSANAVFNTAVAAERKSASGTNG